MKTQIQVSNIASSRNMFLVAATVVGMFLALTGSSKAALFSAYGPAIGFDTGPQYLITFDGTSFTIANDPAQGPYDNIEDTYIAVLNNSTSPLLSMTVSSGLQIFGFDGDGLATYSPFISYDASGYAGPGVTFSNIAGNLLSGTVNFTGGLAPGASTYFSLEEAITTAGNGQITVTAPVIPEPGTIVAGIACLAPVFGSVARRFKKQATA